MNETTTQCDMILAHLRAGNTITGREALDRFGCARLAARIYDIRSDGHPVKSSRVMAPGGAWISEYYI